MKARVVFSSIGVYDDAGRRHPAAQGQVVDLPQEEFDRLAALGAVTKFAGGGRIEGATPHPASTKRSGNRPTAPQK